MLLGPWLLTGINQSDEGSGYIVVEELVADTEAAVLLDIADVVDGVDCVLEVDGIIVDVDDRSNILDTLIKPLFGDRGPEGDVGFGLFGLTVDLNELGKHW